MYRLFRIPKPIKYSKYRKHYVFNLNKIPIIKQNLFISKFSTNTNVNNINNINDINNINNVNNVNNTNNVNNVNNKNNVNNINNVNNKNNVSLDLISIKSNTTAALDIDNKNTNNINTNT